MTIGTVSGQSIYGLGKVKLLTIASILEGIFYLLLLKLLIGSLELRGLFYAANIYYGLSFTWQILFLEWLFPHTISKIISFNFFLILLCGAISFGVQWALTLISGTNCNWTFFVFYPLVVYYLCFTGRFSKVTNWCRE